jgi:hypothetical protein
VSGRPWFDSRQGLWWDFSFSLSPRPYRLWGPPSGRGVKLTTHLHPVSRLRMSGAIPPLPQYFFMAWCLGTRSTLPLHLYQILRSPVCSYANNKRFVVSFKDVSVTEVSYRWMRWENLKCQVMKWFCPILSIHTTKYKNSVNSKCHEWVQSICGPIVRTLKL